MKKFKLSDIVENVKFQIDEDEFEAVASSRMPAGHLAKYFEHINDGKLFEAHMTFFETVLTDESWKRFDERSKSKDYPITLQMLADISTWLLSEVYLGGKASESATSSGTGQ